MPALDLSPDPHPIRTRAIMLNSGMLIQVIPGDRPMRLDRVERATHNGRTCLVLHGMQATRGGRVEPVEYYVGTDHTVVEYVPGALH